MAGMLLVAVALACLIVSVPVGISLCIAMLVTIHFFPVSHVQFITQSMYSGLDSFPLLAIPCFMLAGSIMETGGLSKRLINVALKIAGNTTGGLGAVTIIACLFFGAISGSSPATVAAIGAIMIPNMVKYGYEKLYSTGLVAVAGGLGVIIPPSIPFVVYGVVSNTSVGTLFMAGFVPGFLIAAILLVINYFRASKRGFVGTGEPFSLRELFAEIKDAIWALVMPGVILGGIYGGIFTPTEASVIAIVYGILVGKFVYKELSFKDLYKVVDKNTSFVGAIMLTFAPAGALGAIFALLGIPQAITEGLMAVTTNKLLILLLVNAFLLVVGMLIDTCSAIIIMTPILLPTLIAIGVDPVHFGIIITVNLAVGFVTPPVAGNLFVASALTKIPLERIAKSAIPFIIGMVLALLLLTYIEVLSLGLPRLFGMY